MKLYHGSNMSIEEIDLKRGRKGKDFGQGFYLSADRSQALMMAERTVDREESGEATLTTYLFDESILFEPTDLRVKVFENYSKEWAEFIIKNRRNKSLQPTHDYDIVYGPIADDGVTFQLRRHLSGAITIEELVKELHYAKGITFQYFFGTPLALSKLTKL